MIRDSAKIKRDECNHGPTFPASTVDSMSNSWGRRLWYRADFTVCVMDSTRSCGVLVVSPRRAIKVENYGFSDGLKIAVFFKSESHFITYVLEMPVVCVPPYLRYLLIFSLTIILIM